MLHNTGSGRRRKRSRKKEGNGTGLGRRARAARTYDAMRMHRARIRAFEFQPRVFMRFGRVWWEKTKNMAS